MAEERGRGLTPEALIERTKADDAYEEKCRLEHNAIMQEQEDHRQRREKNKAAALKKNKPSP